MSKSNSAVLSKQKRPTAILFDFDGVIVDSQAAHQAAWRSAAYALWEKNPGPYPQHLSGRAPTEIAAYFAELNDDPGRVNEYMLLKLDHLLSQEQPAPLLPGVKQLFARLKELSIPFGIASNAPRSFVQHTVAKHGLDVEVMFGFEDYTLPKPNPEPYLLLAERLNISEADFSDVWICEDSVTGITAAAATGMYVIGVKTVHDEDKLKDAGANLVVQNLSWLKF